MALSMSVSAGAHNARHNTDLDYRATLENVDAAKSCGNVVLADEGIGDAYARLFGAATDSYNSEQMAKGHPERCIGDYRAKIEDGWKADQAKVAAGKKGKANVPQPCYEYVFQIGNADTWRSVERSVLVEIYAETFERVKARTEGAIDWFQAAIHVDELGAAHMHSAGIAYGIGNKRGLETQVSMSQALKSLGLKRLPDLQNMLMREMEEVAHEHGIERDVMECDRAHQDVPQWKQTQRDIADMVERLETKTEQVNELDRRLERLQRSCEELEPLAQTFGQSAKTLIEGRGDGARERELAAEKESLGAGIGELERQVAEARGRVVELESGLPGLRDRHHELGERFALVERRVSEAIGRLSRVPNIVSEWAQEIARKLGKRIYDPNSLDEMGRRAREAARGLNAERSHRQQGQWRGHGR